MSFPNATCNFELLSLCYCGDTRKVLTPLSAFKFQPKQTSQALGAHKLQGALHEAAATGSKHSDTSFFSLAVLSQS